MGDDGSNLEFQGEKTTYNVEALVISSYVFQDSKPYDLTLVFQIPPEKVF